MSSVRFSVLTIASVLAAAALWSCNKDDTAELEQTAPQAREQPSSSSMSTGADMMQEFRAGCPMVVEGAHIAVDDTEEGVALTFTKEAGDLDDLRARVEQMAQMYGMHAGQRGMRWHHMGGQGQGRGGPGMGHMAGRGPMPAADARVTDVDKGARLELRPTDASQLEHLREHVRLHQQRMRSGECWMLQADG